MKKGHLLLMAFIFVNTVTATIAAQSTAVVSVVPGVTAEKVTSVEITAKEKEVALFESEILTEINLARSNPEIYVQALEELKKYYKGNELTLPNESSVMTNEGVAVVDEAIEFLRQQQPSEAVKINNGLVVAAKFHLKDMIDNNLAGHKGSDGSMPDVRLARFGTWNGPIGELVDYGSNSARRVVIKIILDDGVASRGHRLKLFNPNFKVIGLALGKNKMDENLCVVELAQDFSAKAAGNASRLL